MSTYDDTMALLNRAIVAMVYDEYRVRAYAYGIRCKRFVRFGPA